MAGSSFERTGAGRPPAGCGTFRLRRRLRTIYTVIIILLQEVATIWIALPLWKPLFASPRRSRFPRRRDACASANPPSAAHVGGAGSRTRRAPVQPHDALAHPDRRRPRLFRARASASSPTSTRPIARSASCSSAPRGRLRVSAPMSFGFLHLAPALRRFSRALSRGVRGYRDQRPLRRPRRRRFRYRAAHRRAGGFRADRPPPGADPPRVAPAPTISRREGHPKRPTI